MEYAFFTIGSAVSAGGLFGGVASLFKSLQETKNLTGKVRNTQYVTFYLVRIIIDKEQAFYLFFYFKEF